MPSKSAQVHRRIADMLARRDFAASFVAAQRAATSCHLIGDLQAGAEFTLLQASAATELCAPLTALRMALDVAHSDGACLAQIRRAYLMIAQLLLEIDRVETAIYVVQHRYLELSKWVLDGNADVAGQLVLAEGARRSAQIAPDTDGLLNTTLESVRSVELLESGEAIALSVLEAKLMQDSIDGEGCVARLVTIADGCLVGSDQWVSAKSELAMCLVRSNRSPEALAVIAEIERHCNRERWPKLDFELGRIELAATSSGDSVGVTVAKLRQFAVLQTARWNFTPSFAPFDPSITDESEAVGQCARVWRLLCAQPDVSLTIRDVAPQCDISVDRLAKLLNESWGTSFAKLRMNARLLIARRLMEGRDLSLMQIAAQCGFRLETSFSKAFTRHFGAPPRYFRQLRIWLDADERLIPTASNDPSTIYRRGS